MSIIKTYLREGDFFAGEAHGLIYFGKRGGMKAWCGYVGVPETHPLYEKGYGDTVKVDPKLFQESINIDDIGPITLMTASSRTDLEACTTSLDLIFRVHGGLTFAGRWPNPFRQDLWFFGFDCSHAGDRNPYYAIKNLIDPENDIWDRNEPYRTEEYTRGQCERLAKQLAEYKTVE